MTTHDHDQAAPGWMPPAPPPPGIDVHGPGKGGRVALLIIVGALVLGGLAFGGYTLINNQAEKTACQQLADDNVQYVNPSHAWDLYETYKAAPSGTQQERNAIDALNSFCQERGVRTNDALPPGSNWSSSSSSTTQQQSSSGNSFFSVTQGSDSDSQWMASHIAADPNYWLDDNGNTSSFMTAGAVCERNTDAVSRHQFNCNITFNSGSTASYWVSFSNASRGYDAARRTS